MLLTTLLPLVAEVHPFVRSIRLEAVLLGRLDIHTRIFYIQHLFFTSRCTLLTYQALLKADQPVIQQNQIQQLTAQSRHAYSSYPANQTYPSTPRLHFSRSGLTTTWSSQVYTV